jgi:phage portal protein BeeE
VTSLLDRMKGGQRSVSTIDDYAQLWNAFTYGGLSYTGGFTGVTGLTQTLGTQTTELAPNNFIGLSTYAYQSNGPVFACMMVRQLVFSSIRFRWQRIRNGQPSDMFGNQDLKLLEQPWPGGTTQDLLVRTINDADLAGNSYWYRDTSMARLGTNEPDSELVRLRPDWVDIVVEPRVARGGQKELGSGQVGYRKLGYVYTERDRDGDPVGFNTDEVMHFAPIPDPMASYRGMSWLTPILREIQADQAMTRHQRAFFDNGATVNMVVKHPDGASQEKVRNWVREFKDKHSGAENAYKTLNLYPGADVTVVGSNMEQIDFKNIRGGGETRIAAAAGVPPVIVGLSEGLAAATYSNYGQARRRLSDGTAHPLWQNLAGSMQQIVKPPGPGVRLWYDADDVPFLREDEMDAAAIQQTRAATIASLIASGFTPESAVSAVDADDFVGLLEHTGLTSVQLQKPGEDNTPPAIPPSDTTPSDGGSSDDSGG